MCKEPKAYDRNVKWLIIFFLAGAVVIDPLIYLIFIRTEVLLKIQEKVH